MRVDGLLFDKDGTLLDFVATWNGWAADAILEFAGEDTDLANRLANAMDFDLANRCFLPNSILIAGTNRDAAEAVASVLDDPDVEALEEKLMQDAAKALPVEAVPLEPFLTEMAGKGLKLGVMTNDTEFAARAHLKALEIEGLFDIILGFDSGFGAKPDPGPLLAFSDQLALAPERVAMVGDSTHDLVAGRAAGMQTIAVLTGVAGHDELAPYADVVLPDIGHIPAWLNS